MAMELSPKQAIEAAISVYALRTSSDMRSAWVLAPSIRDCFRIDVGTRLEGVTGIGVEERSGLGFVAWGSNAREGECLVALRGTASGNDWLTDARFGGVRGPAGYVVHAGFMRSVESILPQIRRSLSGRTIHALHIVGHSLGGAMAALIAEALTLGDNSCDVRLYTFGAPRSGVEADAAYLTKRLGASRIYRVYHDTDPVPMVPLYPYAHVPYADNAYRLRGCGTLVSAAAHFKEGYRVSVEGCTWSSLPVVLPAHGSFEAAREWLARAAQEGGPSTMLSAMGLELLLAALQWIVTRISRGMDVALFAGATVLDALARVLYSGMLQSVRVAEAVRNLIVAAMRFMGRTVASGVSVTAGFIRYVLDMLFHFVAGFAKRALDLL